MRINEFFFADSPVFTDRVIMSGQVVNVIMRSESSVSQRSCSALGKKLHHGQTTRSSRVQQITIPWAKDGKLTV